MYMYGASGNSGFFDWHDGGSIKGAPAAKIFATELDFDSDDHDPLWLPGHVSIPTQGFQLDVSDPTGRTIHLLDDVRLDASGPGEKLLTFTYLDGSTASPVRHEVKISSKDLKPDRRVVLPTPPTGFPDRGAFTIAPATAPQQAVEQSPWIAAKVVASPSDMAPGCCWYDPSKHQFYVCPPAGNLEFVGAWSGCRYGPVEHLRGLYLLGGNSYGHQKQYGWGSGLTVPSRLIEDVTVGFSTTGVLSSVPGTEVARLPVPLGAVRNRPRRRTLRRRAPHRRPHQEARTSRQTLRLRRRQLVPLRRQRQPDQEHPLRQPPHLGRQLLHVDHERAAGLLVGPVRVRQRGAEQPLHRLRRRGHRMLRKPHGPQQHLRQRQAQRRHLSRLRPRVRHQQHQLPRRRALVRQRAAARQRHRAGPALLR